MGKGKRRKSRALAWASAALTAGIFLTRRGLSVFGAIAGQVSYQAGKECDSLRICICLLGIAAVAGLGAWFCSLRAEAAEKEERRLL